MLTKLIYRFCARAADASIQGNFVKTFFIRLYLYMKYSSYIFLPCPRVGLKIVDYHDEINLLSGRNTQVIYQVIYFVPKRSVSQADRIITHITSYSISCREARSTGGPSLCYYLHFADSEMVLTIVSCKKIKIKQSGNVDRYIFTNIRTHDIIYYIVAYRPTRICHASLVFVTTRRCNGPGLLSSMLPYTQHIPDCILYSRHRRWLIN